MDRLIFTALSGMTASMTRQRVISSNMANAQTIGFRAETLLLTPITLKGPTLEARAMNDGAVHGADMATGTIVQTSNPLDLSMEGDALLAVQAQSRDGNGEEAYTRRGDLSVSPSGVLENGDGRPVIGQNGPITVPLGTTISIAPDGSVMSADPATPDQPPVTVDRIKLASPQGSRIAKALDGLFRVQGGGVLPADENARVTTKTLEQSNVKPAEVLTEMIEAQRLFDIRTKLVATARELDESGASLMRIS